MLLKHVKNWPPLHVSLNNSFKTVFQNSEGQVFDQVAKDARSVFTLEKWPLMAELKLKVSPQKRANSAILNFSSAIRGHLENVNTHLTSLATWSKTPLRFLKGGLVTELLRKTCKRGHFSICFSSISIYSINLQNSSNDFNLPVSNILI